MQFRIPHKQLAACSFECRFRIILLRSGSPPGSAGTLGRRIGRVEPAQ